MANEPRVADSLADYLTDPHSALPEPVDARQAAERAVMLYERSGYIGATFNLYFGDLSGQPYHAVALYSDLVPEPEPGRDVDVRIVQALIVQNQELLRDPRNNIGLWYDDAHDLLYLDISAVMPDRDEARRLGELYNEKASTSNLESLS